MITDNTKGPYTTKPPMTFEEWLSSDEGKQYANLPQPDQEQKYQEWLKKQGSDGSNPTLINPQFTDNTKEVQPTEKEEEKPISNVDMLGVTDILTQMGIMTGNQNVVKAGLLGNVASKAIKGIQSTKGLTGINKVGAVTGNIGGFADAADQLLFSDQAAKNSATTNTANGIYDSISSGLMTMGPYGAMIGGAMKIGGLLSDGLTALGVGTDQMTTTDQILDSKFLKLTPAGLINGIGASTTDKFTVDKNLRSQIGSSYGGAYKFMDDAASKANKKYGLFSSGAKNEANEQISEAKTMQSKIGNINKEARDKQSIVTNTSELLSSNYMYRLSGGIDQRYLRAAKDGGKLDRIQKINFDKKGGQIHNTINLETKKIEWKPVIIEDDIPEYKDGGNIEWKHDEWTPNLVEDTQQLDVVDSFKEGGNIEKEWKPTIKEDWPVVESLKEGNKVKRTEKKYKTYEDFLEYIERRGKYDDYDYEGFYNDEDAYYNWEDEENKNPGKAHLIDKYKLPNHITFSTKSKYSNSYTKGGEWFEDDNGVNYKTSPYVEKLHSLEEMIRYFRKHEPGVNLIYDGMLIPAIQPKPFTPE